jgi:curved DNA-binding protein CbpA
MSTTDGADDVPFHLMPVAAVLGMLAAFSLLRLIYLIASSFKKSTTFPYAYKPPSSAYMILAATFIGTSIGYAKVVAQVNNAMELSEHRLFDPLELLEIDVNANTTVIKQAYRSLSKIHHPDKGGSPQKFQSINLAYQALTDQTGMENYKKYGHPQGPPSSHSLDFALPEWLLHPQGNVVFVLLFLYLGMFVLIIYTVIKMMKKDDNAERHVVAGNVVAQQDMAYIASNLLPTTSHLDILYLIATSPTNLQVSEQALEKIQKLKQERLASSRKKKKKSSDNDFELDMDSGWADEEADDDEKEAAQKARQLEEEQKKERLALAKAQGTETVLLEGVDDGVLGQAWVEATLTKNGKWPPQDLGFLEGKTFPYKGKQLSALEHPVVRRNLCITHGRLNSNILNGHTELCKLCWYRSFILFI